MRQWEKQARNCELRLINHLDHNKPLSIIIDASPDKRHEWEVTLLLISQDPRKQPIVAKIQLSQSSQDAEGVYRLSLDTMVLYRFKGDMVSAVVMDSVSYMKLAFEHMTLNFRLAVMVCDMIHTTVNGVKKGHELVSIKLAGEDTFVWEEMTDYLRYSSTYFKNSLSKKKRWKDHLAPYDAVCFIFYLLTAFLTNL